MGNTSKQFITAKEFTDNGDIIKKAAEPMSAHVILGHAPTGKIDEEGEEHHAMVAIKGTNVELIQLIAKALIQSPILIEVFDEAVTVATATLAEQRRG